MKIFARAVLSGMGILLLASLAAASEDGFKIIHVADLATLIDKPPASGLEIFDANPGSVREKEGVIPGAKLLSSYRSYDVATTLPPAKNTKLVFYCHNTY